MSCTSNIGSVPVVMPAPVRARLRWLAVRNVIVAMHDAFREALEMRRAGLGKYRLDNE